MIVFILDDALLSFGAIFIDKESAFTAAYVGFILPYSISLWNRIRLYYPREHSFLTLL